MHTLQRELKELEAMHYRPSGFCHKCAVEIFGFLSMIDQKVLAALTECALMSNCPLCYATMLQIIRNVNPAKYFQVKNSEWLLCGMGGLHFTIRGFENLFKMAWYAPIQKNRATKKCVCVGKKCSPKVVCQNSDQGLVLKRNEEIKKLVWEKLGLRVFEVRAQGSGSSNDGS